MIQKLHGNLNCLDCPRRADLFNLMTKKELELINENRFEVKYKAGEVIIKQGTFANHFISLTGGLAKIYLEGFHGKNLIIGYLKPTQLIGGPGTYVDNKHYYSVRTLEDCTTCFIELEIFKHIVRKNKKVTDAFVNFISKRAIDYYDKFISLTQRNINSRVAEALLYLKNNVYEDYPFDLKVSRSDLADLASMTNDSAGKVLKEFQNQNIIQCDGNEIAILNEDRLIDIKNDI